MLEENVAPVLDLCGPKGRVLDVGGWASPFNRADYVMDTNPYETRGWYGTVGLPKSQGGEREFFTKQTWIQRDICDRTPWPFGNKFFDFAICSHTLEDIRDPLFVCSELVRVSNAGYIETPSRMAEQSLGWESPLIAGLSHHRWLVEIEGNHVRFTPKYHCVHGDRLSSFPNGFFQNLSIQERVTYLFWADDITTEELILVGLDESRRNLREFVDRHYQHSLHDVGPRKLTLGRIAGGVWRRLRRAV